MHLIFRKTISILGLSLLMGSVALSQTSTSSHKSSKRNSTSSTQASSSGQTGSTAYGSPASDSSSAANSTQPANTSAQTASTTGAQSGSSAGTSNGSAEVKAGNSGFDDSLASSTSNSATPSAEQASSASQTGSSASGSNSASVQTQAGSSDDIVNGPVAETVTDSSALIGWATRNAASNTGLKYGTNRTKLDQTAQGTDGSDGKNHHARLQSLQPSTRYYFQVTENGQNAGGVGTFKTTASGETPVQSKAIIPQK